MKKVLNKKRKINIKDVYHWFKIIIVHYIIFALYLLLFMTIKFYIGENNFWPDIAGEHLWVGYTLIITPAINVSLHLIYRSIGSPWTRLAMWIHSFINMILIPIIIFSL